MIENHPLPNLAEAREMLDALPAASTETIVTISKRDRVQARSYPKNDSAKAAADLATAQGHSNCYFQVNELKPGALNRKAKKEDIASIRMLHVDVDHADAIERIRKFQPPPSWTLHSGGGAQAFWFLDEPLMDIDLGERLNKAIAERVGGDNCHNADRIMRLAGTLNVPNSKKQAKGRQVALAYVIRDLTDPSRRYSVKEMEDALPAQAASRPAIGHSPASPVLPIRFDELPVRVSEFTVALVRDGDHLERPIGSAGATYASRSEAVHRVVWDLARAGADENAIVGVLIHPANGISTSIREKRDPETYAFKQARAALSRVGEGWPTTTKLGHPTPSLANALVATLRLGLKFEFDLFKSRKRVDSFDLPELVGDLSDDICTQIRGEVLRRWGFDPGKEHIRDAVETHCLDNAYHPIRDYLDGLVWDGKPRIGRWLTDYMGAEYTPFNQAVGEIMPIAAVRRVRQPGVKFDTITVLEGGQGSGKSMAIQILASPAHFSDQDILLLDTRGQIEAMEGIWFFEISELQGLGRADVDKVKSFASRSIDRARLAYGRFPESRPRQCILIGTTNDDKYLRDPTGNRRFWPVKTGVIDLEGLRRDRDQLFAEAALLEAEGRSITLPEHLWPEAGAAQAERMLDDPWEDPLMGARGTVEGGVERISTSEVMAHLQIMPGQQHPGSAKRIAPLMRKLGWTGPKQMRVRGTNARGYERSAPEVADDPSF